MHGAVAGLPHKTSLPNFAPMDRLGKGIIIVGLVLVIAGIVVWLWGDKLRFLGRLPGDIRIEKDNIHIYIPITTMILLSALVSFILWLVQKFR